MRPMALCPIVTEVSPAASIVTSATAVCGSRPITRGSYGRARPAPARPAESGPGPVSAQYQRPS
jgi:hypothetical protein